MRPIHYTTDELTRAFDGRKVLTLELVKTALGTPVKMTALPAEKKRARKPPNFPALKNQVVPSYAKLSGMATYFCG